MPSLNVIAFKYDIASDFSQFSDAITLERERKREKKHVYFIFALAVITDTAIPLSLLLEWAMSERNLYCSSKRQNKSWESFGSRFHLNFILTFIVPY